MVKNLKENNFIICMWIKQIRVLKMITIFLLVKINLIINNTNWIATSPVNKFYGPIIISKILPDQFRKKEILFKEILLLNWQDKLLNSEIYLITIFMKEQEINLLNFCHKQILREFTRFWKVKNHCKMNIYKTRD